MNPVIYTSGLVRRFGDTVAVNDLALEVYAGEVFGFLGHNGAGKTTTIRLLNGVLEPDSGSIQVLGFDPTTEGALLRRRTGVLTENPSLEERLSAHENLRIYAELYDVPEGEVARRIVELLEDFELADRADERVGGYSKGMKQRLALARALLHKPELLFLDEPTAGLDPVASHRVHELILHMSRQEGRTVFICTHNLAEAQKLCDRVAVLEHGQVIALGTPKELARRMGQRLGLEVEIGIGSMAKALEALQEILGNEELSQDQDTIKVAGIHREMIPNVVARLASMGVPIYRVAPSEPSLEDFYLALHGEVREE
jgi:ABC-2 type transport system ATP-binding protein